MTAPALADSHLAMALQVAVPLLVHDVQRRPREEWPALLAGWRRDAGPAIYERGDILQYGSKKRGETAKVFNEAARGVAALSFHRGGITFAGLVWCAYHAPGGARWDGPTCPRCLDNERTATGQACPCCSLPSFRPAPPPIITTRPL